MAGVYLIKMPKCRFIAGLSDSEFARCAADEDARVYAGPPRMVKDKLTRFWSFLILGVTLQVLGLHAQSAQVTRSEGASGKNPRVALLLDEPDLEALLVAGFSGVETVGRAELPKIAAERVLAGGSLDLTHAEVALVVERSGERGVVKIVQCESGATVVVLELPRMPVEETARWIVARTRPLLGAVADPMRPRISLPGLRFVTDSAENRVTERALNLMLTTRLQARGAVVLERWRMGDLVFEKSLGGQEGPFWKAAEIVDGSVSAAGGRLSARVRIRDEAGVEKIVQAEGGTAESLVDDVSARVLAGRWKTDVGEKQKTEADAFLAEAKWMLAHGLSREAWQSTESALALGVGQRREAEMLRVKAAAMCAYPDDLKSSHGQDGGYRMNVFTTPDMAGRVLAATEAMLLAGDYWNAHLAEKYPVRWTLENPASLGIHSLYTGLRVLRAAHDFGWAKTNGDAVRGLRDAIRRNVALMEVGPLGYQRTTFLIYLTNYAGYWSESPAEAVDFYRRVLAPDFDAGLKTWAEAIRGELAYGDNPHPPFLTGDAPKEDFYFGHGSTRVIAGDEAAARVTWGGFLDELAGSPHVLNRADSLALRWQSTGDKSARIALAARMADFMAENVDALAGPQGYAIFRQFIEPLRHAARSSDFAGAQQKLIDAFVALIRAEAAVSPKILSATWALFEGKNVNNPESQGREVLAALDARAARSGLSAEEISGIDSARSSIWKRFPELRSVENSKDEIVARSVWIAGEHTPSELAGQIGFSAETAVWQDGYLWVLDPFRGRLWQIEPSGGNTVVHSAENRPKTDFESQLVGWGRSFAITAERGVWVLDESRKRWTKIDLPAARYRIGVAHGDLWAVSGEAIRIGNVKQTEGNALYRITSGLGAELVASSRRRPAVHPLDAVLAGEPFSVSPSGNDGVIIGVYGENWTFLDSVSATPPQRLNERFIGNVQVASSPELIMRYRHQAGDRNRLVRIEFLDSSGGELLLTHPSIDRSGPARFDYPKELEELPAGYFSATWNRGGVDVLAWSSRGSPWGAAEAWLVRIDAEGYAVNPLRFAWPADGDQRAMAARHEARVFRYPHPDARGLIATDDGLVVTGRGMGGFWYIPKGELDARRKVMRAVEGK